MKKILVISLLLVGCHKTIDVSYPVAPAPSIVGTLNVSPNPTSGVVTMSFLLDPNSKYNLQVVDMKGNSMKSLSINTATLQQNFSALDNGTYDLILIDISGNQTKTPLIIKK